jgi:hypothetical protein
MLVGNLEQKRKLTLTYSDLFFFRDIILVSVGKAGGRQPATAPMPVGQSQPFKFSGTARRHPGRPESIAIRYGIFNFSQASGFVSQNPWGLGPVWILMIR